MIPNLIYILRKILLVLFEPEFKKKFDSPPPLEVIVNTPLGSYKAESVASPRCDQNHDQTRTLSADHSFHIFPSHCRSYQPKTRLLLLYMFV
jgi:hypothetical protein